MSILKSMNIGLSGLGANGRAMSAIGDNIANVNTVGYKRSRMNFADVLGSTTLGIGDGVGVQSTQQLFDQGAIEMTGVATDMAITGDGFFMVNNAGSDEQFFTRAGQFGLDKDGYLGIGGLRLQGYGVDSNGDIATTAPGDLQIGGVQSPPQMTANITLDVNLDANSAPPATTPFDPTNPGDSSNYSSSVTLFDSQGNAIQADIYYVNTGANSWEYHVLADGGELTGGTAGTAVELTTGTLDFDVDGVLTTHTPGAVTFNPLDATQGQALTFDFTGSTQFAGENTIRELTQDGYAHGEIRDLDIDTDGTIIGIFSNGEEMKLGQVALATFKAPEGLKRMGNNLWSKTQESGEALVGGADSGDRGGIAAGALEASNVDLAHEFVKMIAAQRGFQANSRTVTTGDQMLQEVMNLKR